ncbi:MAG TPA: lytic transglycosylase domain-containing protein, partial [Novosphingobium sp.]|nr:lytic transglycosylase domain-containing protein [Novosphingobium sp.]
MKRTKAIWLAGLGLAAVAPAPAAANSAAVDYFRSRADRTAVPALLSQDERAYYKDLFGAIEHQDWARVQTLFAQKPDGPLHQVARAEYFLDAKSPRIELDALSQWLAASSATPLPQTEQVAALAMKRGATALPQLPTAAAFVALPSSPKRLRPRDTNDGTMPALVAAAIQERIKADDPLGARLLLDGIDAGLSAPTRAEYRAKIAWSFYIENDDASAYALAQTAADGTGPWVAEAWWTAGLSAFRLDDCQGAADAFGRAAGLADNVELKTAALYWQSRSLVRCRHPEAAAAPLKLAAARDETFYGMLAAEQL